MADTPFNRVICCGRVLYMSGALIQSSLNQLAMSSRTCAYVASQDDPESWHGSDSSEFALGFGLGGPGLPEWHCPHPPLGQDIGDEEYCVFHTDIDVSADYQQQKLLEALKEAGEKPWEDRPEHRGQFVGATFGAIDISGETITATDDYDIRFDHARFQAKDNDLDFNGTTFKTEGHYPISFKKAEFITTGDGDVKFSDTTFRTDSRGDVQFRDAMFRAKGDGTVRFNRATFKANDAGNVDFYDTTFRTDGDGDVQFSNAMFRADDLGHVSFFGTTLIDVLFWGVDFGEAHLGGAELTRVTLRGANITGVSVNGETTCRRLHKEPQLTVRKWGATAQNYHDFKKAFSNHGLVGKARSMHVQERHARRFEAKAAYGRFDRRYLRSLPSWLFTGYGVRVRNLVLWMGALFVVSTAVYVYVGVEDTFVSNVSYSVLAFTVAPPEVPEGVGTQVMMMAETFFGTLSIVLLGYILGNRERF